MRTVAPDDDHPRHGHPGRERFGVSGTDPRFGVRWDGHVGRDRAAGRPGRGRSAGVGLGWSYCSAAAAGRVVETLLRPLVVGSDALDVPGIWSEMITAVRNAGRPGLVNMAIAAVDLAL